MGTGTGTLAVFAPWLDALLFASEDEAVGETEEVGDKLLLLLVLLGVGCRVGCC